MEYSFFIYLKESRADILLFLSIAKKNICNLQYLFIHSHISTDERNQLRKKCQRKDLVEEFVD